jgi:catechol 2,3-dioxygenase-like lactoylglutathione lyase family enzyme
MRASSSGPVRHARYSFVPSLGTAAFSARSVTSGVRPRRVFLVTSPSEGRGDLLKTVPALPVKNVAKAAAFYRDRLGFEIGHTDDNFGIVTRSGIEIHLWAANDETWTRRTSALASRPVVSGAESFLAGTASCRIEVRGIEALYAELKESGVLYAADTVIETTPWGTREFPALDLERNLLTFNERISD